MEHRLFVRYPIKGTILVQPDGTTRTVKADLVDMSFKGCAAYSKEEVASDLRVKFFIKGEDGVKFQGSARIIYAHPVIRKGETLFRLGVEFLSVDSELVRDILLGLQKRLEKQGMQ